MPYLKTTNNIERRSDGCLARYILPGWYYKGIGHEKFFGRSVQKKNFQAYVALILLPVDKTAIKSMTSPQIIKRDTSESRKNGDQFYYYECADRANRFASYSTHKNSINNHIIHGAHASPTSHKSRETNYEDTVTTSWGLTYHDTKCRGNPQKCRLFPITLYVSEHIFILQEFSHLHIAHRTKRN